MVDQFFLEGGGIKFQILGYAASKFGVPSCKILGTYLEISEYTVLKFGVHSLKIWSKQI